MTTRKLHDGPSELKKRFDCRGRLARLELFLTVVVVTLSLLKLTRCDLVKAHAEEVVLVDLRDCIRIVDEIDNFFLMQLAFLWLTFSLHQVKLVTGEHIDGPNALFLIFKQVALLDPTIKFFLTQGLS